MKLTCSCALTLLGFASAWGGAQERQVTLNANGWPLKRLANAAGIQAGMVISVPGSLEHEPVIASVTCRAPEFVAKLADVFQLDAVKTADGYRLVPSSEKLRNAEAASLERRSEALTEPLAAMAKRLAEADQPLASVRTKAIQLANDLASGQFEDKQITALIALLPAQRAAERALVLLGAKTLASLPMNHRIVFSSQPNRLQRQLAPGIVKVALDAVDRMNAIGAALPGISGKRSTDNRVTAIPVLQQFEDYQPIDKSVQTVILEVRRSPAWKTGVFAVAASLVLLGPDGSYKMRAYAQVIPQEAPAETLNGLPKDFKLSEEAATVSNLISKTLATGQTPEIADGLAVKLSDPEHYEPLAWHPSELLQGWAQANNRQLLAVLPDSAVIGFAVDPAQLPTSSDEFRSLLANAPVQVKLEGGWALIMPQEPAYEREVRVSRASLRKLLAGMSEHGGADPDAAGTFLLEHPALDDGSDTFVRIWSLIAEAVSYRNDFPDWLRLYSTLDAKQRDSLRTGHEISFSALSQPQLDLVWSALDDRPSNLKTQAKESDQENGREDPNGFAEPTVQFENGFSNVAMLKGHPMGWYKCELYKPQARRPFKLLDARTFLQGLSGSEPITTHDEEGRVELLAPAIFKNAAFRLIRYRWTDFTIRFGAGHFATFRTAEQWPMTERLTSLDGVPADLKKQILGG